MKRSRELSFHDDVVPVVGAKISSFLPVSEVVRLGFVSPHLLDVSHEAGGLIESLSASEELYGSVNGLWWVSIWCKKLRWLDISNMNDVYGDLNTCLDGLLAHNQALETLICGGCGWLEDQSLQHLGPLLHKIYLGGCSRVSDSGVQHVAMKCPEMDRVYLNSCQLVSDKSLEYLSSLKHLSKLYVPGCHLVGDQGVIALTHASAEAHKSLEILSLAWTATTRTGVCSLGECDALASLTIGPLSDDLDITSVQQVMVLLPQCDIRLVRSS